ncbi:MAG: sugar-binding protein, partial [Kiritimatiellae bacterium]|nr:sugar-binding protein [Kiritimatiellia bacterium]
MSKRLCEMVVVAAWACGTALAAGGEPDMAFPNQPPTLRASPLTGPVVVDGRLDEAAWAGCVEVRDTPSLSTGLPGANGVAFRVGYSAEKIYLAVECPSRTTKPTAVVKTRDGAVYGDDSIELYLQSDPAKREYCQLVVNALGTRFDARGADRNWNGAWETAVTTAGGSWRLELAIPFETLGVKSAPGAVLGFNLIRNDRSSGGEALAWCGTYHAPEGWGRLVLGRKAYGLSGLAVRRVADMGVSVSGDFRNPGAEAAKVGMVATLSSAQSVATIQYQGEVRGAGALPLLAVSASNAVSAGGKLAVAIAVAAGDEWPYISPSRQYEVAALPAQATGGNAVLENEAMRLEFAADSGDLISLVHKASGVEMRPRKSPAAVFALETVAFRENSVLFPTERIQTLTPDATTLRACRVEVRRLTQKHVFPCGLEATVMVELPEQGSVSRWRIELDNKPTWHPSRAMIVYRTLFPRIIGLRTDADPAAMKLAIPQICGMLVPDPVANLAQMPAYHLAVEPAKEGAEYKAGRYAPGWASMTWEDLSGPKAGIYLASHDIKPVIATCPESASDAENKEIELSIRRMTITYPGEKFTPAECSVGLHGPEGWYWSADRYREWFYSAVKVRQTPEWLHESSGWLVAGGGGGANYVWEEFPAIIRLGKPYGMAYVQKWQALTGDDVCEGGGRLMDSANFPFPNPYCGSFKKFQKVMKEVHALGGRVGFYRNFPKSDAVMGQFVRMLRYAQKIPPGTQLPDENPFAGGWTDSTQIGPEGGYATVSAPYNNQLDGTWWMCAAAKSWMDFSYDWSVRWNREYKLDAIYLDSCGPVGMRACFNPRHGLDGALGRPHDQAPYIVDFYRRLARGTHRDYGIL